MEKTLQSIGLNSNNSVVIGSGILGALGIRKSNDIDLVVTQEKYDLLKKSGNFEVKEKRGKEILAKDLYEVMTGWDVLDKNYKFEDFLNESTIINGARYMSLDLLYRVKKSWLDDADVRPKDISDVKLIEEYLSKHKT